MHGLISVSIDTASQSQFRHSGKSEKRNEGGSLSSDKKDSDGRLSNIVTAQSGQT